MNQAPASGAWEHPSYIAEYRLRVLLNGILGQCTVPNSVAHDVIEVLSLEHADDAIISRVTAYICFCKYYSGSNNTKKMILAETDTSHRCPLKVTWALNVTLRF